MSYSEMAVDSGNVGRIVCVILALSFAGCRLPDVEPYAEATAQLHDAIRITGEVTVARIRGEDREPFDPANPPGPQDPAYEAWDLQQLWQIRLTAAGALVTYADALADITAAGHAAGDNARNLAAAINEVAAGLPGIGAPSQEIVALAAKLGEIAGKVKAANDLAEAVEKAQPAVEGIAAILEKDLDDLLIRYQVAYRKHIKDNYLRPDGDKAGEWLRLATYIPRVQARVNKLRVTVADSAFEDPNRIRELQDAEQLLAAAQAESLPIREEYRALERERERVEALFHEAKRATAAWVQTHHDLAAAIRANRRPNWRELLTAAQELHLLVEGLRTDERPVERTEIK